MVFFKSSRESARRHISKQIVAYFACKLIQRSCLALTLIALSGDIELNPGYRTLKSTKDFRGLKIAHLNVRSIRNKIDQIQFELLQGQFFDILTISESWLNDTIDDAEVQIPGFSCVRKDREESEKGGGNIVYIRDGLPFRIRHDLNNNDNECLWFEIVRRKCKPILICSVYKAPEANLESFISSLEDSLLKLDYCNSDLVLLGDFNVDFTPCKGKSNTAKQKLLNFSRTLELSQLVKEPTRVTDTSRTTIDLIFVNNEHRFVDDGVIPLAISDHYLVYCILKVGMPKGSPRVIEYRSYKNYNRDDFLNDLNDVPWHLVDNEDNINDAVLTWNKLFSDVADNHAPIKKRRVNGINSAWMTSKISDAMRDRDYHHRKARKSGSAYHWQMFRKLRNFVNKEIKASKSKYYTNLIEESKGNASKIWNAVNEATCRKNQSAAPSCIISDEVQHTERKAIAAALNKHFATIGQILADRLPLFVTKATPQRKSNETTSFHILPVDELFVTSQLKSLKANKATGLDNISARLLKDAAEVIAPSVTLLLNRSTSSHTFPSIWKCAKVIALFKAGDKERATNYRPISLLPTLSKLLERAVHIQFYEYLAKNKLLNEKQYGFRPKCSTTTSLSKVADEILAKMENGQLCGAVLLDLSKAFDTVNHSILITLALGVCNEDLAWIKSYLNSQTLRTASGPELSDPLPCNVGVPQGSILGPLFFIIYIISTTYQTL